MNKLPPLPKRLIPDSKVWKDRYGVSPMTGWRWDHDPTLNFPRPIVIRGRKYRDEAELDAFDESRRRVADAEAARTESAACVEA